MSDENKTRAGERPPPIVIRKGQVTPLSPEVLASQSGAPAGAAKRDDRPLWKRLAEEKAAERAGPGETPATPAPAQGAPERPRAESRERRDPRPPGGPGSRGARGEGQGRGRGDRPREERRRPEGERSAPPPMSVEPPPLPELPVPDEGSFADLFAEAEKAPRRRFQVGEKVAGKILQIGHDVAFLELGSGTAEGMIEVVELQDEAGQITAQIGDIVDGVVVKGGERGVVVSKGRGHKGQRDREALVEAARNGLPVEGVVKAANKGGLEVEVMGQRAFCPMSQIDLHFVADPASFVGQKLLFKVQRADDRDAVLSRRALLEEERADKARATREKLAEGAVFEGTVTSVQDYGAFVDLGGIEGLVHVSELAWDRVSKPQDLLQAGDAIQVQVLKIEQDSKKGERISLSVRALTPRPEPEAPAEGAAPRPARAAPPAPPRVGDVVTAKVDKIEPFGVFVRFAGGRGLIPASETGTPRGADLRKSFKVGDDVTCLVSAIDEQKRIRLSKTEAEAAAERAEAQEYMKASAPRGGGKGFGTLGDLLKAKLGK
ncbi:MAG TPA: S1 RNA-binding domain-containing protein [Anaeromyxobacteraceae bacterium]|jgi:small subunit ribosomal protein S1|nr:S1 RNA-binding domain-containing protein [Anaeromyxobacteraceae bacterium]